MTKPVAFYDTECYPNLWLLKIRVQNGPAFTFKLRTGERFDEHTISCISELFDLFTVISFNGIHYDVPMISAALIGFSCEQLKWLNDEIIVEQRKPWELGLPTEWKPSDHIDIMQVLPGDGSQKQYAGRIHCKTMRDLPYEPNRYLTESEIAEVDTYCGNDLDVLEALYDALEPQRVMREQLSEKYGIDLRSKSDAQMAEAVIKLRCEQAVGQRIYKPEVDWNLRFRYETPAWVSFTHPELQRALDLISHTTFGLDSKGRVGMPAGLEGLEISIGAHVYRMGIGGLHSKDERAHYVANDTWTIRDNDVASYYPNLMLNSGHWPTALGPVFLEVLRILMNERLNAKEKEKQLKKLGIVDLLVHTENEGGKIMINGTFGKTGSIHSILFAPEMMIQTTITGQLGMLMLIEWHEAYGIQVISANTDGFVIRCRRDQVYISEALIAEWQKRSGLEMETTEYSAIYMRDVNSYFAVKLDGEVKRKGEYSKAGLIEKKNPDVEICSDAVADFLSKGTPILYTLAACRDIRKFVRVQKVAGGAVKLWGEGPQAKLVRDMTVTLEVKGWVKAGRKWERDGIVASPVDAYRACFSPQRPEYLGKVVRWYYGTNSPGPMIYNTSTNRVGDSYGAQPCMTLPDDFPSDIDYEWYIKRCQTILEDVDFHFSTG
jgi:hypothetical protein